MSPRFVSRSALTKHGDKYVNKFQRLRLMKFNSLPKLRFVRLTIFVQVQILMHIITIMEELFPLPI